MNTKIFNLAFFFNILRIANSSIISSIINSFNISVSIDNSTGGDYFP